MLTNIRREKKNWWEHCDSKVTSLIKSIRNVYFCVAQKRS